MEKYDVVVVGAGHAGCEAALAAARMGFDTLVLAMNLDSIAMMPCNPCVGGSAKGHLVREVDALGGQMGKIIDRSFLQSRMLNLSKGPAVYSLRAQADKAKYSQLMKQTLENTPNLTIKQAEVTEIISQNAKITGVKTEYDTVYDCSAVIICTGTYLNARCLCGDNITASGPNGMRSSAKLTAAIANLGFRIMRFKTGTPARVHKNSLDFSKMQVQPGDLPVVPFSFDTPAETVQISQTDCYLTYTNEKTHAVITQNLHRSPMYSGVIEGVATRYCPSIEDKIARFVDKNRHPVFIEPEGANTAEMYVQGLSTSMPADVQLELYRTVPGLENCEIMRNGYAIEYDCVDTTALLPTLQAKSVEGLFFAGQINGTSGYEEAAAQGIIAGINAALLLRGENPLIIDRSMAYIGVLIDDLVTKGTPEPYRMMTSRAEYRLLLRQDNADLRLMPLGYKVGLISEERYSQFLQKKQWLDNEILRVKNENIPPSAEVNALLVERQSTQITTGVKLADLVKRPELDYMSLSETLSQATKKPPTEIEPHGWQTLQQQVNIQIKYEGYINMQKEQVAAFRKLESQKIPPNLDYQSITGLRLEARQKLAALQPLNIGQAQRISGVSPADINVLIVYIKTLK